MRTIGVRELKRDATEIVRLVHEHKEEVVVTDHGKGIARIIPCASQDEGQEQDRQVWEELLAIGRELSKDWPKGLTAARAVREERGELW